MAVITLTECTVILGITGSAQNSIITTNIPIVEDHLLHLCNNRFFDGGIYQQGSFDFYASNGTIVSSNSWAADNFVAEDQAYITGSYRNDGVYDVVSVATKILEVNRNTATTETVTEELSGASVIVSLITWPKGIKTPAAYMIQHLNMNRGVVNEDIGEYGYPKDVLRMLDMWRRPLFR